MAVESGVTGKRKRKKSCGGRRLLVGERVEVRSEEDGFLGSWHTGTVIGITKNIRHVKYDHLLVDDGNDNLVDTVCVSSIIEGNCPCNAGQFQSRGHIRPLPPPLKFGEWNLLYGLCVDVYYKEAWWEGVVFDHEDGSAKRRIFFPDLGDEMTVGLDLIRITQDWDEVEDSWHRRGMWLFLELIEEYEHDSYIAVSVRQIWYDLQEKKGYKKLKEWTSSLRSLWKELVFEVINDNLEIVLDHFFQVLDLPGSSEKETKPLLDLTKSAGNAGDYPELELANSLAIVPIENHVSSNLTNQNYTSVQRAQEKPDQDKLTSIWDNVVPNMNLLSESGGPCHDDSVNQPLLVLPPNAGGNSGISATNNSNGEQFPGSENKIITEFGSAKCRKIGNWMPVGPDIVPGAEFCPDAIAKYVQIGKKSNCLIVDVKKHLKHLKWKIEYRRDEKGILRYRYFSPDGKCYDSLRQVCLDLMETNVKILTLGSQKDHKILHASPDNIDYLPPEQTEDYQDPDCCPQGVDPSPSDLLVVEPEYNPQAVIDWYMLGVDKIRNCNKKKSDMPLKARKHLSALGWVFKYITGSRRCLYYFSPKGRAYYSLRAACKACLYGAEGSESSAFTCKTSEKNIVNKEVGYELAGDEHHYAPSYAEFQKSSMPSNALYKNYSAESLSMSRTRKLKGKRKTNYSHLLQVEANSDGATLLEFERGKTSKALNKLGDNLEDIHQAHVCRSSNRVKQPKTSSSLNHNPRTVLSWLIDNNVILPRAKVIYCSRKKRRPKAEGRVTRDGIKCNCCGKVFSLSGFEDHAGGTSDNPASHIFLEDGRSLLDCQKQVFIDGKMRNFAREPHNRLKSNHLLENDYICSVCHYGGELILCDQCPSSFHKSCLGLEDIPDGDWFCPSCCCGICGSSKFAEEVVDVLDRSILICYQCEVKYHSKCIQNSKTDKSGTHSKEKWFCSKKCEEIFWGLHNLLGKQIPIGVKNLTWTLVKSGQLDRSKLEASDIEALSKLSLAHSLMHECFEPVYEPYSSGDLAEDVIFSRGSVLNRLNFQGFYTIILEKNEELITVATVRFLGEKAAEIPLVGTRLQYRRLGMCRVLMDELEKKLMEFGVKRLILPAIPTVLNTWTNSFGFSRMTDSERLQLVNFTFLNFPDTIMCQKLLRKRIPLKLKLSRGVQPTLQAEVFESGDNNDVPGSSTISEVSLEEQIEESGIVEQRLEKSNVLNVNLRKPKLIKIA